ncbi:MAG: hypothetical protein HC859_15940 [Bacteroidia bacterium]|nr:hypothetical protein [Bacteroidia bacterium]
MVRLSVFARAALLALVVCSPIMTCHGQLIESFDGPALDSRWSGDLSMFNVREGTLHLGATAAGNAYLSTPSPAIVDATWEFVVRMEFNPSSTNYARVYLVASHASLNSPLSGYYIAVGENADDVSLYKQSGTSRTRLVDGVDQRLNLDQAAVSVRVTRSAGGVWSLLTKLVNEQDWQHEGIAIDTEHYSSQYFGVLCNFSATRSDKFSFDDIRITGSPYVPVAVEKKEIIFTELFIDPTPMVGLPEDEFVEIYNRGDKHIDIEGFTLTAGSTEVAMPKYTMAPKAYLVLCNDDAAFRPFGAAVGLKNFPSLNNTGGQLVLRTRTGSLVDSVSYNISSYRSNTKQDGGYSIELIDTENICADESNWVASDSWLGGTPAQPNSVHASRPDHTPPEVIAVIAEAQSLVITCSEKLLETLPGVTDFSVEPGIEIDKVTWAEAGLRKLRLTFDQHLNPGVTYTLTIKTLRDCAGNEMPPASMLFQLPSSPGVQDVVINEILFNPLPGGVDFVEIYNRSDKYFNLLHWRIARRLDDGVLSVSRIDEPLVMPPQSYLALTPSTAIVTDQYPQAAARQLYTLDIPNFPDEGGTVLLLSPDMVVMDELQFDERMHSPFVTGAEGVSIERIDPNVAARIRDNWKSASAGRGYATPGSRNSNSSVSYQFDHSIVIDPPVFQPAFGTPTFTQIRYAFSVGGNIANVLILDQQGRTVKTVANNTLLGTEGFFRWDGDSDDGKLTYPGYYVVAFEVFNATGTTRRYLKRVAIAPE